MSRELVLLLAGLVMLKMIISDSKKNGGKIKLPSSLTSNQRSNALRIINAFKEYGDSDFRKLAYILATAWHESRLMPIKEIRADYNKNRTLYNLQKRYWDSGYYGRGFVQLTWKENYEAMNKYTKSDIVSNPDSVLNPDDSAKVIVIGMMNGFFTGKKLSDYINSKGADYVNARRVVNLLDRAELISQNTKKFINHG